MVDRPVLMSMDTGSVIPESVRENILENEFALTGYLSKGNFNASQSIAVSKDYIYENPLIEMPYEPQFILKTDLEYTLKDLKATLAVDQGYHSKDDLGNYLRESADISLQITYRVMQNLSLFGKASNLLNRARYDFRTMPTDPVSVSMGFFASF
jgi:hypothetical protein